MPWFEIAAIVVPGAMSAPVIRSPTPSPGFVTRVKLLPPAVTMPVNWIGESSGAGFGTA